MELMQFWWVFKFQSLNECIRELGWKYLYFYKIRRSEHHSTTRSDPWAQDQKEFLSAASCDPKHESQNKYYIEFIDSELNLEEFGGL